MIGLVSLAISLAACATSDRLPPVDPRSADVAVTLPAKPAGLASCFRRAFPAIPDRDLTRADVVEIIGGAKVLDRRKSRCGALASSWIDAVERDFAR